jgi:hypothetical protein
MICGTRYQHLWSVRAASASFAASERTAARGTAAQIARPRRLRISIVVTDYAPDDREEHG